MSGEKHGRGHSTAKETKKLRNNTEKGKLASKQASQETGQLEETGKPGNRTGGGNRKARKLENS